MGSIYNFLLNVYQKAKKAFKTSLFEILIALVLLTLPLHYRFNSISIMLLCAYIIVTFKKENFRITKMLLLPILLYFLMVFSLFWTIDFAASAKSLSKEIPLLLLPIIFLVNPIKSNSQQQKVLHYFGFGMFLHAVFYLIKATIRFCVIGDSSVFFYHQLVSEDTNAIYVSVYFSLAFFIFYNKLIKTKIDFFVLLTLFVTLVLLSSKNIIVVFFLLLFVHQFLFFKTKLKSNYFFVFLMLFLVGSGLFFNKIKDRFLVEIESNSEAISLNKEAQEKGYLVYNVSIYRAWTAKRFENHDFFTGTSLRAYQIRIFLEMMQYNNAWLTGFGANATDLKIKQKQAQYHLYPNYGTFNFHNQYIQTFAEIGIFGFLVLLALLVLNIGKALQKKDFLHFSFAVLMISLFLTESFLARVRGVVFFTILYCIFNQIYQSKKDHSNKSI